MQDLEPKDETDVLRPSVPWDIGARSQRQRIFDAMAKTSAEKTFSGATIADIVGHASISRATFYKHFANKRECFEATVNAFVEELQGVGREAYKESDGVGPEPDAVRMVVTAIVEHLAAKPDHAKLLLMESTVVDPLIVQRYRGLVLSALESQRRDGVDGAPGESTDPEAAFGSAVVLVAGHLNSGQAQDLKSLIPELIYITLRPYAGQEVALAQARLSR